MHVHHLPLAAFEVEDVAGTSLDGRPAPFDRLVHARPADAPFLPGIDLVRADEERAVELLQLTAPERPRLAPAPPLRGVGSDDEGAGMVREAREHRLGVAIRDRPRQAIDDPPDLLGRLHRASLSEPAASCNPARSRTSRTAPATPRSASSLARRVEGG